jgi:hypothetical protein
MIDHLVSSAANRNPKGRLAGFASLHNSEFSRSGFSVRRVALFS